MALRDRLVGLDGRSRWLGPPRASKQYSGLCCLAACIYAIECLRSARLLKLVDGGLDVGKAEKNRIATGSESAVEVRRAKGRSDRINVDAGYLYVLEAKRGRCQSRVEVELKRLYKQLVGGRRFHVFTLKMEKSRAREILSVKPHT